MGQRSQRTAAVRSTHCGCTCGMPGAAGGGSWIQAHVSLRAAQEGGCLVILHMGIHPERSAQQRAHTEAKWQSQDSNPSSVVRANTSGLIRVLLRRGGGGGALRARLTLTSLG